jgi:probable HAF family extracellular repeat protein
MRFQTIDEPNADEVDPGRGTYARAINNKGEIVGEYSTNIDYLGFADIGGSFLTVSGPLIAESSGALGVNDLGQVVGQYQDSFFHTHGFLFSGGIYTTLNDPNANNQTIASGINAAGQIVGWYTDAAFHSHGFKYSSGIYTDIDVPGANNYTAATAINASGQIVGYFQDGSGTHGFLDVNGSFTTLDDPLATNGTYATGINDQGQIVGCYGNNVGTGAHGFRYSNGVYTTIDLSDTTGTHPFGINNAGQIVGYYIVAGLASPHGFIAQPNNNSDFNGNGMSDVLWRGSNGALINWSMSGSAIAGSGYVTCQGSIVAPDASWTIAGTSDFNGDGSTDVLWRQNAGSLVMWQVNGSTVTSSSAVTYQGNAVAPDASWTVAGTADFNGDGKADILWRQGSGALSLWQMDGSSISASSAVTCQGNMVAPDASWNVAGIADFNGDAKTDILWRNTSGALALWQMNGASVSSSGMVTYQGNTIAPDASWTVAGVGDFNGDGSADLLWRSAGGALALWQMNGSAVTGSGAITCQGNVVAPDASWKVVEIGDFNGDGNSDILWRNANGSMAEWLMNGSQITASLVPSSQGNPTAPDSSWIVQAKPTNFG